MRDLPAKTKNYLTEADVEGLRQQFELKPDVPLHQLLEDAIYHCFCDQEASDPSIGERRKQLTMAAVHAEALRGILAELPFEDQGHLNVGTGIESSQWDRVLARLSAALHTRTEDLPRPKQTGRAAKHARRRLVRRLRDIYSYAGGARHKYSQDPDTSAYSGPQVEFMEAVCKLAGIRANNRAIGDTLKEIIKAEKSAKND